MAYTDIDKPEDYFNTVLYTGTGSTINLNTVGFQPDFTWIKGRSLAFDHCLFDSVRGGTKQLYSNLTNAEFTWTNGITFDSEGVDISADSNLFNGSGYTYASWNWLASNTTASNTDGSITSTVSANTTSGFSIVTYTGNNTSGATVGHGLGVAPSMMIVKNKDNAIAGGDGQSWFVYHISIGATGQVTLNTTAAIGTSSAYWNNTAPTSTVFSLGSGNRTNYSGDNYIAYCFAEKKGFSKIGSYTGNGSTDGSYIHLGFKPAWVMIKAISRTGSWYIFDNKRSGYNGKNDLLLPNVPNAELSGVTYLWVDLLSNGFKLKTNNVNVNESSQTYSYMAFAENPFTTSTGIPTTAR
jgi:hypothetical protein